MQLSFLSYEPTAQVLRFAIENSTIGEGDAIKRLSKTLLAQQLQFVSEMMTLRISKDATNKLCTLSNCDDIANFLMETKKCFLDAGITQENWMAFVSAIEAEAKRDLSLFKNTSRNLDNVAPDAIREISSYLDRTSQGNLKETNKAICKITSKNYEKLLSIHFPMDYLALQATLASSSVSAVPVKLPAEDYKIAYQRAFKRDYYGLNTRKINLFTLFKEGDLDAIRRRKIFSIELLDVKDASGRDLLMWAGINKHQVILDYCYQNLILPNYQLDRFRMDYSTGMGPLHWAICCQQSEKEIAFLLRQGVELNDDAWYSRTVTSYIGDAALIIAVKRNLLDQVKYLTSYSQIKLFSVLYDESGSHAMYPAFCLALMQGQAEIVTYLSLLYKTTHAHRADVIAGTMHYFIEHDRNHLDVFNYLGPLHPVETTKKLRLFIMHDHSNNKEFKKYISILNNLTTTAFTAAVFATKLRTFCGFNTFKELTIFDSLDKCPWKSNSPRLLNGVKYLAACTYVVLTQLNQKNKLIPDFFLNWISQCVIKWAHEIKNSANPLYHLAKYLLDTKQNSFFKKNPGINYILCINMIIEQSDKSLDRVQIVEDLLLRLRHPEAFKKNETLTCLTDPAFKVALEQTREAFLSSFLAEQKAAKKSKQDSHVTKTATLSLPLPSAPQPATAINMSEQINRPNTMRVESHEDFFDIGQSESTSSMTHDQSQSSSSSGKDEATVPDYQLQRRR